MGLAELPIIVNEQLGLLVIKTSATQKGAEMIWWNRVPSVNRRPLVSRRASPPVLGTGANPGTSAKGASAESAWVTVNLCSRWCEKRKASEQAAESCILPQKLTRAVLTALQHVSPVLKLDCSRPWPGQKRRLEFSLGKELLCCCCSGLGVARLSGQISRKVTLACVSLADRVSLALLRNLFLFKLETSFSQPDCSPAQRFALCAGICELRTGALLTI